MNILICNYGSQWLRGQELALLDLLRTAKPGPHKFFVWCNNHLLSAEAERLGIPAVTQDDFANYLTWSAGPFRPFHYLSLVRDAIRMLRRHKIDAVHCNGLGPCQWLLPACWLLGIPIVGQLHITYLSRNRLVLGGIWTDHLVGVSEACVTPFRADGVPAERLSVIYNGVEAVELQQTVERCTWKPPEIPAGVTPLLVVASLVKRKGIDVLFDACRQIGDLRDRYHVLIAGDGPDRAEIEQASHDVSVTFLGEIDRDHVLKLLASVGGVLILPSRAEGFPLSLLEAATFSIPGIVTRIGGMPEFIEHGENGFVIERDDSQQLAVHLRQVICDEALRGRLSRNAKLRAAQFSLQSTARNFSDFYSSLPKPSCLKRLGGAPARLLLWKKSTVK